MAKNTMRNMTEGSVARHLFFFALPMMIGGLLQQFYNMVDSMVVGNFVSDEALAAVSSGWLIALMAIGTLLSYICLMFLTPYMEAANAAFYRDISRPAAEPEQAEETALPQQIF